MTVVEAFWNPEITMDCSVVLVNLLKNKVNMVRLGNSSNFLIRRFLPFNLK